MASQLLPEFSSGLAYSVPATLTSFQSWLCQDLNLEAFCWLFPLPGLLFSQIKLTSPHLLQSLLKYPLTNDAYHDDPPCSCLDMMSMHSDLTLGDIDALMAILLALHL